MPEVTLDSNKLIQAMKDAGWKENEAGTVYHPDCDSFSSWEEAIIACIQVASNV